MKITTSKKGRPIFIARYIEPEDTQKLEAAGFWRHSTESCKWGDHCMACEAGVEGYYTPFAGTAHTLWQYADERALREIAMSLKPRRPIGEIVVDYIPR
jgi:hypothetical protein